MFRSPESTCDTKPLDLPRRQGRKFRAGHALALQRLVDQVRRQGASAWRSIASCAAVSITHATPVRDGGGRAAGRDVLGGAARRARPQRAVRAPQGPPSAWSLSAVLVTFDVGHADEAACTPTGVAAPGAQRLRSASSVLRRYLSFGSGPAAERTSPGLSSFSGVLLPEPLESRGPVGRGRPGSRCRGALLSSAPSRGKGRAERRPYRRSAHAWGFPPTGGAWLSAHPSVTLLAHALRRRSTPELRAIGRMVSRAAARHRLSPRKRSLTGAGCTSKRSARSNAVHATRERRRSCASRPG